MSFVQSGNRLKSLKFRFCDWGGSSKGIREVFASDEFYSLVNKNEQTNFNFNLKRNKHPVITAEFLNGFKKDICVKNKDSENIYEIMRDLFNQSK